MLSLNTNSFFSNVVAKNAADVDRSMEKLSSGKRVNRSADDAAGLSIAEVYRSQSEGSQVATRNIQTAMNLMNIAMDGVQGTLPVLQRIRELVLQGANANYNPTDRQVMQTEVDTIRSLFAQAYIVAKDSRIALDGNAPADRILHFQVGPQGGNIVSADFNPLRTLMLQGDAAFGGGILGGLYGYEDLYNDPQFKGIIAAIYPFGPAPAPSDPMDPVSAAALGVAPGTPWNVAFPKRAIISEDPAVYNQSLAMLDQLINGIVEQAAYLGAVTNRLQANLDTVLNFQENIMQAESTIRDTDMAFETTVLTKSQVLMQSSQEMLKQMNARPFRVLELLQGN